MVTMDGKTVTTQVNFMSGLLSGLIFLSEKQLYSHQGLVTSNILFDVAQYSLKIGMTHSHHVFIFRRAFDRQFLHDVDILFHPFF